MSEQTYDAVVLGGGSAGERCSVLLARAGWSVAVVEEALLGGVCPYLACIPSKALLRPAHVMAEAGAVPGIGPVTVDPGPLMVWRDELVRGLDDTKRAQRLAGEGVALVRGRGRLDGSERVAVDLAAEAGGGVSLLTARRVVIVATGAETVRPPIEGLDQVAYLTSDDLTVLDHVPEEMVIVGGGIIGCELAQAYAALGAGVTVVDQADRLLDGHEAVAGRLVAEALAVLGVTLHLATTMERVRSEGDQAVVELGSGKEVRTECLAVAVGRRPRLHGIGLESAGIDADDPGIDPATFRTASGVVILGDAAGGRYTHMANAHADVVVGTLIGGDRRTIPEAVAGDRAPGVVFTIPQVASVGVTTATAPAGAVVVEADLGDTAAAATMGEGVAGAAVAVFGRDRCLLGLTLVGPSAGEMLHAATIAVANELTVEQLASAIPPFPTLSGIWDVLVRKAREKLGDPDD